MYKRQVQTITVDAIEKKTGNYVLELPTSVNGLIVSKYYTSSGSEIDMANENADKTIKLTNDEITNKKIQISTDYDKKDTTTVETMNSENKVTATLYNKELMTIRGKGKYTYNKFVRQEGEIFFRDLMSKYFPNNEIIYFS